MAQIEEGQAPPQEEFLRISGSGESSWEIQRPQPAIVKLVEQGIFHGQVLDIGCGLGDNAIHIATHAKDVHVTAIEIAPKALEVARKKAQQSNIKNIRFEIVDILDDPSSTILNRHSFDVLLDSAIFHNFSNDDRPRYIDSIRDVIKPGGLYIQLCRSEKDQQGKGPRLIKKEDLYALFSSNNGWTIESIEDTHYAILEHNLFRPYFQAYLTSIRRNENI